MAENLKDIGKMANNMEKVFIICQIKLIKLDIGKRGNCKNG